jgi:lysophospholipase L1-like esterase
MMTRATIADSVLDGAGKPVIGARVTLLRASDYSSLPVADPGPGSANYIRQTMSGAGGSFVFAGIAPDDYHVMAQFDGQTVFRYNVTALPVDEVVMITSANRALVPRTLAKLLRGDDVTIHCIGDSITVGYNSTGIVGGGWVQRLGVLIGQQVAVNARVDRYDPNAYGALSDGPITGWQGPTQIQGAGGGSPQVIQIVNNAVSGDTVQRLLRRFGNLTGWTPRVDLMIIYLGINDSLCSDPTKFVPPDDFAAGIRALIEIIRNYYPMAELAVMTPHANDQPDAGFPGVAAPGQYTLDMYAAAIRLACIETGTACIDLRRHWKNARDLGNPLWAASDYYPPAWLSNAGGNHTHPSDEGHQAIAEEAFRALFGAPGLAAGRDQPLTTLGPRRHFKDLETVRLDIHNPQLAFSGAWETYTPDDLDELYFSSPSLPRASDPEASLTFTGRMQDFSVLIRRGTDCGRMLVSVDGGSPTEFELYRGHPSVISDTDADGSVYPMDRVLVATDLPEDEFHTIEIHPSGTHDPDASDSYVYIDGVEYTRLGYTARKVESPIELTALQYGGFTCALAGARFGTVTLTFPRQFLSGNVPAVAASCNQVDHYCSVDTITDTGCLIRVVHRDGSEETATVTGQWLAVG